MISVPLFLIQSYSFLHFFRSNAKKQCFFFRTAVLAQQHTSIFQIVYCTTSSLSLSKSTVYKIFQRSLLLAILFFLCKYLQNTITSIQPSFSFRTQQIFALMGRMVANSWLVLLLLTMACNPSELLSLESSINKAC